MATEEVEVEDVAATATKMLQLVLQMRMSPGHSLKVNSSRLLLQTKMSQTGTPSCCYIQGGHGRTAVQCFHF